MSAWVCPLGTQDLTMGAWARPPWAVDLWEKGTWVPPTQGSGSISDGHQGPTPSGHGSSGERYPGPAHLPTRDPDLWIC